MIKTTTAVISALLAAGCASAPADKTDAQTAFTSIAHRTTFYGKLAADEWTAAREVFGICMRRLDLSGDDVNAIQSLNIAASVIQSLRPASEPAAEK